MLEKKEAYVRDGFADLIMHCIRLVAPHERHLYIYPDPETFNPTHLPHFNPLPTDQIASVTLYIDFHLSQLENSRRHWQHFSTYFSLLRDLSALSHSERRYLLSRNTLFWLIEYYKGEYSSSGIVRCKIGSRDLRCELDSFFQIWVNLLRSVRSENVVKATYTSPYGWPDDKFDMLLKLDTASTRSLWSNPEMLKSVFKQGCSLSANHYLIRLLIWEDRNLSPRVLEPLFQVMHDDYESLTHKDNILSAIHSVLTMESSPSCFEERLEVFLFSLDHVSYGFRNLAGIRQIPLHVHLPPSLYLVYLLVTSDAIRRYMVANSNRWIWNFEAAEHLYEGPQSVSVALCCKAIKEFTVSMRNRREIEIEKRDRSRCKDRRTKAERME
jgi:hypothetical protein